MPIKPLSSVSPVQFFSAVALALAPLAVDRVVYTLFKKSQTAATVAGAAAVLCTIAVPNISNRVKAVIAGVYLLFKGYTTLATSSTKPASLAKTSTIPPYAFGAAKWAQYIGDVGVEPPIPPSLLKDLDKLKDTHFLCLIPKTVDGKPLTNQLLKELVKNPKAGHAIKEGSLYLGDYQETPVSESHWVLMMRTVVPESRNKSYPDQQQLAADFAKKAGVPYEIPNLIDATVSILMDYVESGTTQYGTDPWTYTRTMDKWQMVVGGVSSGGFSVRHGLDDYERHGVSLLRKS